MKESTTIESANESRKKLERLRLMLPNRIEGILCNYILAEDDILLAIRDMNEFGFEAFMEEFESISSAQDFFNRHYKQINKVLLKSSNIESFNLVGDLKWSLAITACEIVLQDIIQILKIEI